MRDKKRDAVPYFAFEPGYGQTSPLLPETACGTGGFCSCVTRTVICIVIGLDVALPVVPFETISILIRAEWTLLPAGVWELPFLEELNFSNNNLTALPRRSSNATAPIAVFDFFVGSVAWVS